MKKEQQAILALVALGRITPAEAERLLAVWDSGREELWALSVCVMVGVAQFLPAAAHAVRTLLTGGLPGLHHGTAAITYWIGGLL